MSLPNPTSVVTEQRLKDFYDGIFPYLGGKIDTTWSSPVSCLVGDTTCTITDSNILATSIIEDFCENTSGTIIAVSQINVTTGQAILHFDELEEVTSFKVRITNLT